MLGGENMGLRFSLHEAWPLLPKSSAFEPLFCYSASACSLWVTHSVLPTASHAPISGFLYLLFPLPAPPLPTDLHMAACLTFFGPLPNPTLSERPFLSSLCKWQHPIPSCPYLPPQLYLHPIRELLRSFIFTYSSASWLLSG